MIGLAVLPNLADSIRDIHRFLSTREAVYERIDSETSLRVCYLGVPILRNWVRCCVLVVSLGFGVGLVGCGGPPPPPVSIQMNVQPPAAGADGYIFPDTLTATVMNTEHTAVNWQVTCSMPQCGSFTTSPTTGGGGLTNSSTSGQPIYYYPAGPGVITVTFIATAVADPTKTASATITRGYATGVTFGTVPGSMVVGSSAAIPTQVTGDPVLLQSLDKLGFTWTLSCGSADCGTFSASPTNPSISLMFSSDHRTAWGYNPVVYNAPATVPSGGTVTIKANLGAASTPDPGQPSATTTITITSTQ